MEATDGVDMADRVDVGLVITSRRLTLLELAARLERPPQSGSHDKGEQRGLSVHGLTWPYTIWRENAHDADASFCTQCLQVLKCMPPKYIELLTSEPDDISVSLDIAVFYESAYFNLVMPRSLITELSTKGIDFEITAYPVAQDANSRANSEDLGCGGPGTSQNQK